MSCLPGISLAPGNGWELGRRQGPERPVCLDGSCVSVWQLPLEFFSVERSSRSQVRDNGHICSLTQTPSWVWGGSRKRVCWHPVATSPGLSLASPACAHPHKGSRRDRVRHLVLTTLPSLLLQFSERLVGSTSNCPPHALSPFVPSEPHPGEPFYLSSRCLLSVRCGPGTMPDVRRQGWIQLRVLP